MTPTTFWMEKLAEFPKAVREVVELEMAEARCWGRDYTFVRPLMPEEPVILTGCAAWDYSEEKEGHVRCHKPVTHVRYMVGVGEGRPTYYCAEGVKRVA